MNQKVSFVFLELQLLSLTDNLLLITVFQPHELSPFLLYSLAGISRSVTIAAAYIISVTGLSVAEALQAVRSSRTIANPNFGFQKQLYDYFEVNAGAQKVSYVFIS